MPRYSFAASIVAGFFFTTEVLAAPATQPAAPAYHIYAGSTHAHTEFSWSHGEQWVNAKPEAGEKRRDARGGLACSCQSSLRWDKPSRGGESSIRASGNWKRV